MHRSLLLTAAFLLARLPATASANELFVANYSGNRWDIEVFQASDSGNAYPTRRIAGPDSLMDWPWAVAVDDRSIYVGNYTPNNYNQITIFNLSDDSSNIAPARVISCNLATLGKAIAVDTNGIILGTATAGIFTFATNASGESLPQYRIYGLEYGLDDLGGMAADDRFIYAGISKTEGVIHVFNRTDDGMVAPARSIRCPQYNLRYVGAMAVDDQYLYVLNDPYTTTNRCVLIFDKAADGDVMPLRQIKGAKTKISDPMGIAVDGRYIYLTSLDRNSVQAFAIDADGDTAPHHTITAEYPNPYLFATYGIAVGSNPTPPSWENGPAITADGVRGAVAVNYPAPVSIALSLNAGPYVGVPADWWLIAIPAAGGEWYYLNAAGQIIPFPAGTQNLPLCRPALQSPLADIDPPLAIFPALTLPRGTYYIYFAVDGQDGRLAYPEGPILSDTIEVSVQ